MALGMVPPSKAPYQVSHEELKEFKVNIHAKACQSLPKLAKASNKEEGN